jgi:formate dehydrogenase subunit gamma
MSVDEDDKITAATEIANRLKSEPGALLPILHEIQSASGFISPQVVPIVANILNLSRAEVHGVISFYHHFRTEPGGAKTILLCRAESCQAMGGRQLEAHVKQRLGIEYHQTTEDGSISLEPVYCLGNCACSPSMMVDQKLHSRVTPTRFDEIVQI